MALPTPGGATTWLRPTQVVALPGADPVSQTVEWRLDLPDTAARPGQNVRVRFAELRNDPANAASTASQLTVPASAVLRRGELTAVYVVRGGRFMVQQRTIGDGDHSGVAVDGKSTTRRIAQRVGDRIVAAIGIDGVGGDADRCSVRRVLGHVVGDGIHITDRTDVDFIHVADLDGEALAAAGAVRAGGQDGDGV